MRQWATLDPKISISEAEASEIFLHDWLFPVLGFANGKPIINVSLDSSVCELTYSLGNTKLMTLLGDLGSFP